MPKQPQVNTERLVEYYTEQHLTLAEIGRLVGMSRPGVWKRLQAAGIEARQGEHVQTWCDHCGKKFDRTRRQYRNQKKHYCTEECYHASLYSPAYQPDRHGQRNARKVVSRHFNLQPKQIVHHVDKDCANNKIENLWVFACQADHLRYHRSGRPEPLWKGEQAQAATV